jgi:hypothetical protein
MKYCFSGTICLFNFAPKPETSRRRRIGRPQAGNFLTREGEVGGKEIERRKRVEKKR